MAQTKKIDQDRWIEFLSMFSNGNRGRMVAIEIVDMEIGEHRHAHVWIESQRYTPLSLACNIGP